MLELALKKKLGPPKRKPDVKIAPSAPRKSWPQVGRYRVTHAIGSGFTGPCVYEAMNMFDGSKVALKMPAKKEEVAVLKSIQKIKPPGCLGIPELHATGSDGGKPYIVTDV